MKGARSRRARPSTVVGFVLAAGVGGLAGTAAGKGVAPAASPVVPWERAFPCRSRAADVHFTARFAGSDGKAHRLEVWRHGNLFVRRRTDQDLDVYAQVRRDGTGEYEMRFFDHRRHVVTAVKRSDLHRAGLFSDWYGLGHVLERPRTPFAVRAASARPDGAQGGDCLWRELTTEPSGDTPASHTRVCWSERWELPLVIERQGTDRTWAPQFTVEKVEQTRLPAAALAFPVIPPTYAVVDGEHNGTSHED